MAHPARNSKGFSLIEMMIALVLIMISMLALLTATLGAMRANVETELRNTAVRIANQTAEALLSLPMTDAELSDAVSPHVRTAGSAAQDAKGLPQPNVSVRGYQQQFTIQWTVVNKSVKVKEVTITVSYTHRGRPFSSSSVIYKHEAV